MTLAEGLPSVRETILYLPIGDLADIEMAGGFGMKYAVRVVHFIAIEKRDPDR